MKKFRKDLPVVIIIGLIIFVIVGVNIYNYGWKDFFKINIYQVITIIIAVFVTFYLKERKNDKMKLNGKIEDICNDIQRGLKDLYEIVPSSNTQKSFLMNKRYIANKIRVLEKLCKSDGILEKMISYIKNEYAKYDDFVSNNLDQDVGYFLKENRLEKIRSYINNIDNKVDEIIVYLYTGQDPETYR